MKPKELQAGSQGDMCTFIVALIIIAKTKKQLKCPSMNEWITKVWYIHTVEYSAFKRKGILQYAATWMTLRTLC